MYPIGSLVKLQLVELVWNGFDFYYFSLDRIYQSSLRYAPARRIIRNFFACGEVPFGRRPHYPCHPVDLPARAFTHCLIFTGRGHICLFV